MIYKKIIEGTFINRPNRFIANVIINGREEVAHVRNTGRCKELLIPGASIILEDCSDNINRKTKYSIISVWKKDMLVNLDSQIPNYVVFNAIKDNKIDEIRDLITLKREVTFGNSRYDLYFESAEEKGFIEIKGATLEVNGISIFPDAPTTRGTKHALEMIEAVKSGYRGIILFLIQMKGPKLFTLNWEMDEKFSSAIKLAHENGVEILAYDSLVENNSIQIGNKIKINI